MITAVANRGPAPETTTAFCSGHRRPCPHHRNCLRDAVTGERLTALTLGEQFREHYG